MQVELPLDQMTLADKLALMEAIWADLAQRPGDLPSPEWHRTEILERRRLAEEGKLRFLDWDAAINSLREELRGNSPA